MWLNNLLPVTRPNPPNPPWLYGYWGGGVVWAWMNLFNMVFITQLLKQWTHKLWALIWNYGLGYTSGHSTKHPQLCWPSCLWSAQPNNTSLPDIPEFRLVDINMSCTDPEVVKEKIGQLFVIGSPLWVVIATTAFGLGIDCPDVYHIISFGLPNDIESYVKETGRADRDSFPALATLITKKN